MRGAREEEQQRRGGAAEARRNRRRSRGAAALTWCVYPSLELGMLPRLSTRTRGASRPTCRLAWPWIDALAAAVATERLPLPSALLLAVGGIGLRWLGNGCE